MYIFTDQLEKWTPECKVLMFKKATIWWCVRMFSMTDHVNT